MSYPIYKERKEIKHLYFDQPEQVKFKHAQYPVKDFYGYGIAYQERIIEPKHGATIPLKDISYLELLPWQSFLNTIGHR